MNVLVYVVCNLKLTSKQMKRGNVTSPCRDTDSNYEWVTEGADVNESEDIG